MIIDRVNNRKKHTTLLPRREIMTKSRLKSKANKSGNY